MFSQNLPIVLVLTAFHTVCVSSVSFQTNCTLPSTPVNYSSSPNVRGTLEILWSSLFTLFICTWSVQHLNIPRQKTSRPVGVRQTLRAALEPVWEKFKWMMITVLLPEFLIARAAYELTLAKQSVVEMSRIATKEGMEIEWTLTHAFYANMGGFVVQVNLPSKYRDETIHKFTMCINK
jgi:hypothetical protein